MRTSASDWLLSKNKVSTRATGWHTGPINLLLQNTAVIGQFQHSERDKATGERRKIGPVLEGYYPAIIDPALFKKSVFWPR